MQGKNFHFLRGRMAQTARVLSGNLSRDGDIAREAASRYHFRGKRQHIGGLVLAEKAVIEPPEFSTAGHKNGHCTAYSGRTLRTRHEAVE